MLVAAAVNVALAYVTNVAAGRLRDARMILISMAFLSSAGFLGLHALATPGVLSTANIGFTVATPVGLIIAAGFAAVGDAPRRTPRDGGRPRPNGAALGPIPGHRHVGRPLHRQIPPLDGPPHLGEGVGS